MRLLRVPAESSRQIRDAVMADFASHFPELEPVAVALEIPQAGALDVMASSREGRLALISFHLEAGPAEVALALARWDWVTRQLPALSVLAPDRRLDLGVDPRVLLVASRAGREASLLAAAVRRPEIELFEAALARAGETTGVLLERAAEPEGAGRPAAALDPLLAGVAPGAARSLARRVIEELRSRREELTLTPIEGGVEASAHGERLGSLIITPRGLKARRGGEDLAVDGDDACREAARLLSGAPAASRAATGLDPAMTPLTPDEIEELERPSGESGARLSSRPFVEN
ncbi:MAG TPA: hypothetical protein VJV23_06590 [Candidatus Polarisedimenticolia bacterium]|nr:hypothetical protein [Candidatus Polarisedimenticolia bacterium]